MADDRRVADCQDESRWRVSDPLSLVFFSVSAVTSGNEKAGSCAKRSNVPGCSSFDLAANSVIRVLKLAQRAFDSSDDNPINARQLDEWLFLAR